MLSKFENTNFQFSMFQVIQALKNRFCIKEAAIVDIWKWTFFCILSREETGKQLDEQEIEFSKKIKFQNEKKPLHEY